VAILAFPRLLSSFGLFESSTLSFAVALHSCVGRACVLPKVPPVRPWHDNSPGPWLRWLNPFVGACVFMSMCWASLCSSARCWACVASFCSRVRGSWLGCRRASFCCAWAVLLWAPVLISSLYCLSLSCCNRPCCLWDGRLGWTLWMRSARLFVLALRLLGFLPVSFSSLLYKATPF
jgi:hypothetical protein